MSANSHEELDLEKNKQAGMDQDHKISLNEAEQIKTVPAHETHVPDFMLNLKRHTDKLEAKLGMESRGIERVPDDDRPDTHIAGNFDIWVAANCVLSTFGIGVLGPCVFYLGLGDSLLVILFTVIFTSAIPAYVSIFGPRLGLRQMTSARYSWGWHGAKIVALLNCIACVGWSAVNTIAGAQTLRAVADYKISDAAGVVVIAVLTLILGLFGYKYVHIWERWSWIPTAITFIIILGISGKHLVNVPMGFGQTEASNALSFIGTIFGFCIGWVSLASDYNVYMPSDTPTFKIFFYVWAGIATPCTFVMFIGAAVASAAMATTLGAAGTATTDAWFTGYSDNELGGLLYEVLVPAVGGFGKFLLFLLVISVVANNIINVYSMGLSISVCGRWLAAVPRFIWPIIITAIYIPIAIVGANNFSSSLENFMNVLGYWLAIFVVVVLEEHFIFRQGNFASYNAAETWNDEKAIPVGFAAFGAFLFGALGTAMGMAQVWYVSPIGALVGGENPFGGDIGFELSGTFAGITYPLFRWLELKYMKR